MDQRFGRRRYLGGLAATALGVGLAGCGGNEDGGEGSDGSGGAGNGSDSGSTTGGTADDGGGDGNGGNGDDDGTTVDMTDDLVYEPEAVTVTVGETVTWETVGTQGHTVTAYQDEFPDDAEYWASGGFDSEQAARDAYTPGDPDAGDVPEGQTYEHTFETPGTHEYFCIPHEGAGMVGTVEVEEG